MVERGNIDLAHRHVVRLPRGQIATVRSISFNEDGVEVLVPTVSDDGRLLTSKQAIEQYHRTGRHLGKFANVAAATAYAEKLHQQQDRMYSPSPSPSN